MSDTRIKVGSLLPLNANIVELTYEAETLLRIRSVELPLSFTPGNISREADIIFLGVRDLEISLNFGVNPCVSRISEWKKHKRGGRVSTPSGATKAITIRTTKGTINVVCASIQFLHLKDVPVVSETPL